MNEKAPDEKLSKTATVLLILFGGLLGAYKFLWAFTLWYEWIALGLAFIVFLVMVPFFKKKDKQE